MIGVFITTVRLGGKNDNSYITAYQDKVQILKLSPSPRLILVGGSNTAFSFDSEILHKKLPFHPINLGLSMSIPLEIWFHVLRRFADAGDLVIFSLEDSLYRSSLSAESLPTLYQVILLDPSLISAVPPLLRRFPWRSVFDQGLSVFHGFIHRGYQLMKGEVRNHHDFMKRSYFNQYGDLVPPAELTVKYVRHEPNPPLSHEEISSQILQLSHFTKELRKKGINSGFAFPPTYPGYPRQEKEILRSLREAELTIFLSPEQSRYPEEAFLDVVYHLNSDYRPQHTEKLAKAISERASNLE